MDTALQRLLGLASTPEPSRSVSVSYFQCCSDRERSTTDAQHRKTLCSRGLRVYDGSRLNAAFLPWMPERSRASVRV